jgi:bacterial/archaeal transporter family protein
MNEAIIYALLAMLGLGLSNSFAKKPASLIGSEKTAFYSRIISFSILFVASIFLIKNFSFTLNDFLLACLISLYGYIPLLFFYLALNKGRAGIVTPISGTSIIVASFLSILFYNESFSSIKIISILIIVIGIFFLTFNSKGNEPKESIIFALFAALFWGILSFLMKIPAVALGGLISAMMLEGGVLIGSLVHQKFKIKKLEINIRKNILFIGLFVSLGSLFAMKAISIQEVSIVAPIIGAYPIITVIHSHFFLKEKLNLKEWIMILIIIIGIIGLSI